MSESAKVVILDDDAVMQDFIALCLRNLPVDVAKAGSLESLKAELGSSRPTFLIMDLNLGTADGSEIVTFLVKHHYRGALIMISGADQATLGTLAARAQSLGLSVLGTLQKPFSPKTLKTLLLDHLPSE